MRGRPSNLPIPEDCVASRRRDSFGETAWVPGRACPGDTAAADPVAAPFTVGALTSVTVAGGAGQDEVVVVASAAVDVRDEVLERDGVLEAEWLPAPVAEQSVALDEPVEFVMASWALDQAHGVGVLVAFMWAVLPVQSGGAVLGPVAVDAAAGPVRIQLLSVKGNPCTSGVTCGFATA